MDKRKEFLLNIISTLSGAIDALNRAGEQEKAKEVSENLVKATNELCE